MSLHTYAICSRSLQLSYLSFAMVWTMSLLSVSYPVVNARRVVSGMNTHPNLHTDVYNVCDWTMQKRSLLFQSATEKCDFTPTPLDIKTPKVSDGYM